MIRSRTNRRIPSMNQATNRDGVSENVRPGAISGRTATAGAQPTPGGRLGWAGGAPQTGAAVPDGGAAEEGGSGGLSVDPSGGVYGAVTAPGSGEVGSGSGGLGSPEPGVSLVTASG